MYFYLSKKVKKNRKKLVIFIKNSYKSNHNFEKLSTVVKEKKKK